MAAVETSNGRRGLSVQVQHRQQGRERLVERAATMFHSQAAHFAAVAARYDALMATTLTESQYTDAVIWPILGPDPRESADLRVRLAHGDGRAAGVVERWERREAKLRDLWHGEAAGVRGDLSAWEAFQAATEAIDHHRELVPVRSERLAQLLPGGRLAQLKETIGDRLGELAGIGADDE